MEPRRDRLPLLGQGHHRARIQHPEPEEMVELQSDAVHGPVEASFGIKKGVPFRGENRQMLHVPPRQVVAEKHVL